MSRNPIKPLRREEQWAQAMMTKALGVRVVQNDDGSEASMHDLAIVYPEGPVAACEVVTATDAQTTEFWRLIDSQSRWIAEDLKGGWLVEVMPSARVKRLRADLPAFLATLEALGSFSLDDSAVSLEFRKHASQLGVVRAFQGETEYPGSIYVMPILDVDQAGGMVAATADAVAHWVGDFLHAPEREDVRRKLAASGASGRHAFVLVSPTSGVPFNVMDPLLRADVGLPTRAPKLPSEITQVWVVSGWSSGVGLRWSDDEGWQVFDKLQPS